MDAEITKADNTLYYVNAKFGGKPLPDETRLGITVLARSILHNGEWTMSP